MSIIEITVVKASTNGDRDSKALVLNPLHAKRQLIRYHASQSSPLHYWSMTGVAYATRQLVPKRSFVHFTNRYAIGDFDTNERFHIQQNCSYSHQIRILVSPSSRGSEARPRLRANLDQKFIRRPFESNSFGNQWSRSISHPLEASQKTAFKNL